MFMEAKVLHEIDSVLLYGFIATASHKIRQVALTSPNRPTPVASSPTNAKVNVLSKQVFHKGFRLTVVETLKDA